MADRARAPKSFTTGEHVAWDTSQGEISGRVVGKVTGTAHVKGHTAKASEDEPQYRVRSDRSGDEAIHRPEALRRRDRR